MTQQEVFLHESSKCERSCSSCVVNAATEGVAMSKILHETDFFQFQPSRGLCRFFHLVLHDKFCSLKSRNAPLYSHRHTTYRAVKRWLSTSPCSADRHHKAIFIFSHSNTTASCLSVVATKLCIVDKRISSDKLKRGEGHAMLISGTVVHCVYFKDETLL